MPVTTRLVTFLVGDAHNKPSFATTGCGVDLASPCGSELLQIDRVDPKIQRSNPEKKRWNNQVVPPKQPGPSTPKTNRGVKKMQLISHSGYNVIRGWNHRTRTRSWCCMSFCFGPSSLSEIFSKYCKKKYQVFCCGLFFPIREIRCFFRVVENQGWFSLQPHVFAAKILRKKVPKKLLGHL